MIMKHITKIKYTLILKFKGDATTMVTIYLIKNDFFRMLKHNIDVNTPMKHYTIEVKN